MAGRVFAEDTASISELKLNAMKVMEEAEGRPVAVLNRNNTVFYCVPSKVYEDMILKLREAEGKAGTAKRRRR